MADSVTQYQQGFAPDIAPYARNLLSMVGGTAQTNPDGTPKLDANGQPMIQPGTGMLGTPYTSYQQYAQEQGMSPERIAQFSGLQNQSFNSAAGMGNALGTNAAGATGAGADFANRAANTQYTPSQQFANQYQAPDAYQQQQVAAQGTSAPTLQNYQMQGPGNVQGIAALAANMGNSPQTQAAQMRGPDQVGYQGVNAARVNAPQLGSLSMQAARDVSGPKLTAGKMGPAAQVGSDKFGGQAAQDYMNPYMQSVVAMQQREAQRAADIATTGRRSQATQQGAFGGSRQAVMDAEAARNLATQQGDIQAQGLNQSYQQAQTQFNTDQARQQAAQQANQQAGLSVGQQNLSAQQQTQGLNANLGQQAQLANQANAQQANTQNLSAGLQTQGLGAQTGLQAQGMNQATGLQALLANQQAGVQTGQFNATNQYNTAAQNAQMQQQANLANQAQSGQYGLQQGQFGQAANMQTAQNQQQANLANQQMGMAVNQQNLGANLQTQGLGAGQNMQSQLANQQAGLAAQQANMGNQQFGYGQGMNAAASRAQYGQQAAQLGEQASQYGAGLGMQGLQAGMTGMGQAYNQNANMMGLQNQFGTQQQAQAQNMLNTNVTDYNAAMNAPYKSAAFASDVFRGAPLTTQSASIYNAAPSMVSQLGGLGASAYGLSKMAHGGQVQQRPAGLAALAIHGMA